jgi:hypothetical protein
MMRNGSLIHHLLCAAIALGSQRPTLVRAEDGTALPPPPVQAQPVNAHVNNASAPHPAGAGSLGASLQLKGDRAAVRLEVRRTSVASALAALGATYHMSIRSAVMLDALRDGTYAGSLRDVIARLLDGYNYVIEEKHATLDVFVVGKSDGKAVPAPTMAVIRQHRIPVTYRISGARP